MSDQGPSRDGLRNASDLWPRRRDTGAAQATDTSPAPADGETETSAAGAAVVDADRAGDDTIGVARRAGANDLRPPRHDERPLRREPAGGATVRDRVSSTDLRPTRADVATEEQGADATASHPGSTRREIRDRVERIQREAGLPVGENPPPVTGRPRPASPPYSPPPYSAPRPAAPPPPPQASEPRGDQGDRPPLGAYPPNSPSPSWQNRAGDTARPWAGVGPDPNAQPPADRVGPGQSPGNMTQQSWAANPPAQGQPPQAPNWGQPPAGQGQWGPPPGQPQWGPPPGQAPWVAPPQGPWGGPPPAGPGQNAAWNPPAAGQWGPPPAPNWGSVPYQAPPRVAGSGRTPWGFVDILLVLLITAVVTVVLTAGAVLALEGLGRDTTELTDPVVFLVVGATMYVGIAAGVWAILIARRKLTWADLGFRRTSAGSILLMLPLAFGMIFLVGVVAALQDALFGISPPEDSGLPFVEGDLSGGSIIAAAIVVVILAPLFEELLFRGVIFQYLRSRYLGVARGLVEATLISALAFASLHLGGSILPILPVGIILALVMHRWNSIWPPIALHVFYNGIVLTITLLSLT